MYILLTDETNRRGSDRVKFFAYGGLVLPLRNLVPLHNAIEEIRREAGYRPGDEFKFDTRSRPDSISHDVATEAKKAVVALCRQLDCKFIVCISLHRIIRNQSADDQILWAANHVIGRFNLYLEREVDDYGICVVDNLPVKGSWQYLADKFMTGLELQGDTTIRLDRILMFAASCINASHASSAMDIVLGSFRYCINDPSNEEAAREMMAEVVQLMWADQRGENIYAMEKGLIMRPLLPNIKVPAYREEYEGLLEHINHLIDE